MAPSNPLHPHRRSEPPSEAAAVAVVAEQLAIAVRTKKCWLCGCLHDAVTDFARSRWADSLRSVLDEARVALRPREYDCLGCAVCHPAVAVNAIADAAPEGAVSMQGCPAAAPIERVGWPPLPGDYRTLRYEAPVAVCTLNSPELMVRLAEIAPHGLGIVGTLRTENLGVERIVHNVTANPHLRFLILCGPDTEGTVGHLPGRSLLALVAGGVDERGRIIDAPGRRPVLKNIMRQRVDAFRQRIEVLDLIGAMEADRIIDLVTACARRSPGPCEPLSDDAQVRSVVAIEPERFIPDPAGYVVIHTRPAAARLIAEHYTNQGVLDCVVEGATPAAVVAALIDRDLVTRMEHATYLGQELARAERALHEGVRYVQDKAPGAMTTPSCGGQGVNEGSGA